MLADIAEIRTETDEPLYPIYDIVEVTMQRDDKSIVKMTEPTVAYSHSEKMILLKSENISEFKHEEKEETEKDLRRRRGL